MTTVATQIRARIDAIAAERSRLDDEERRLMKALEALEPTEEPPVASGVQSVHDFISQMCCGGSAPIAVDLNAYDD